MKICKLCKNQFQGRSDKIFCSIKCKSEYAHRLRKVNSEATSSVDTILHRNRSILLEVMGKNLSQKKVDRAILDRKKFNFNYVTQYHLNSRNKMVNYIYDFSWIVFSDQEVLIKRIRKI